jgi:WD40 repeat protein
LTTGHIKTVNCVRFSKNGLNIATASDDAKIVLWKEKMKPVDFTSKEMEKNWGEYRVLTGHGKEIFDLKWSNCGRYIFSCSLDYSVIVWDTVTGELKQKLQGHKSYVKGNEILSNNFNRSCGRS